MCSIIDLLRLLDIMASLTTSLQIHLVHVSHIPGYWQEYLVHEFTCNMPYQIRFPIEELYGCFS